MALSGIFLNDGYGGSDTVDPLTRAGNRTRMVSPQALTLNPQTPAQAGTSTPTLGATPESSDGRKLQGAAQGGIAVAKFMLDLQNAKSAYSTITGEIANNKLLSNLNESDTYVRGREAELSREVEGELASGQGGLALAAQGIDLSSGGAQNVLNSYKAMGIYNATREKLNTYREAFKYDIEQAQLDYADDMALVNFKKDQLNAALNFAGSAASSAAMFAGGGA